MSIFTSRTDQQTDGLLRKTVRLNRGGFVMLMSYKNPGLRNAISRFIAKLLNQ